MNTPKKDHNREFHIITDAITAGANTGTAPSLLLHACCAPCASICMDRVRDIFETTVYFYNPNITNQDEYTYRYNELKRLISIYNDMPGRGHIELIEGKYDPEAFFDTVRGYEDCPERGDRCGLCYRMRLGSAAETAAELGSDYFATTLTLSPLKDAARLNEIGYSLAEGLGGKTLWLPSDFKKEDGYKKSIELSAKYGLYRQNYCGCIYSKPKEKEENE